jgi:hypothetical protein
VPLSIVIAICYVSIHRSARVEVRVMDAGGREVLEEGHDVPGKFRQADCRGWLSLR